MAACIVVLLYSVHKYVYVGAYFAHPYVLCNTEIHPSLDLMNEACNTTKSCNSLNRSKSSLREMAIIH